MEVAVKQKTKSFMRDKNFLLILIGQIVSNVGNAVHSAAVAWFVMELVGEKSAGMFMGIFGICNLIPTIIFGPISGVFVDKLDRRKIIYGTDLLRGGFILILALFTYLRIVPIIVLLAVTAINSLLGTLFNPAVDASIPNVVSKDDLTKANSINSISRQLTWVVGAAISGFLYYSVGIVGIFIVNGISFILSGISEMFIVLPPVEKTNTASQEGKKAGFWADFKDGLRFMKGQKAILILLGLALFLNFFFNPVFMVIFPKAIKFTLGMSPKEYGIMQSISSIGAIGGMLLLTILPKFEKSYKLLITTLLAQSILIGFYGIPLMSSIKGNLSNTYVFIIFCVLEFTISIFNSLLNIPIFTVFQRLTPDEYRGRFFGMIGTLCNGIVPIGLALIGYISDVLQPSTIFVGVSLISILLSIGITFFKEIREL